MGEAPGLQTHHGHKRTWFPEPPYGQQYQSPPGYTQPPPPYQQPPPVVQTVLVQGPVFGRQPVNTTCKSCGAQITTATKEETGVIAYVIAAVTCALGIWCGCCLIPFCMDNMKDVTHFCPNCNAMQGKY